MTSQQIEQTVDVSIKRFEALAGDNPLVYVDDLCAGYGNRQILHNFSLRLGRRQSLCLIGPNGAGKSTVLNAVFGLNKIFSGRVTIAESDGRRDITHMPPKLRLAKERIAYVLQENSLFPEMSVEENLLLGGFLKKGVADAELAVERIFEKYPSLAARRGKRAGVLSGGERRLLEIARALIMEPRLLLLDEPSIGLEPRNIDGIFKMLNELQHREDMSIIVVEQNVKHALRFADIACVMVSGRVALVGAGNELQDDAEVEKLFLGD